LEVLENKKLKKKSDHMKQLIQEKTVSLSRILKAKIHKKHRMLLFEWYFIFESSMYMSQERMTLRKMIYDMLKNYEKEYENFKSSRKEFLILEKHGENFNELYQFQKSILEAETSLANKEVIYAKYCELREKPEMDEEYYKLKSWIRQAISLPFDKIKEISYQQEGLTKYLIQVRDILNKELYGMEKVKEQLLLYIHHKITNPESKGWCLGLIGPPGVGKCLHPDTKVLLYDGQCKKAKNIVLDDILMGEDGSPRFISSITKGKEQLYHIHQSFFGRSYIVNSSHILTLYDREKKQLTDITIPQYLQKPSRYLGVKTNTEYPLHSVKELWNDKKKKWKIESLFSLQKKILTNHSSIRLSFVNGVIDALLRYQSSKKKDSSSSLEFSILFEEKNKRKTLRILRKICDSLGILYIRKENKIYDLFGFLRGSPYQKKFWTYPIQLFPYFKSREYVGFTLDKHHRFLLSDGTVTHNTSIALCLSKCLDLPFEQISFGGMNNADFIKGHDYTYVGSRPGEIVKSLTRMKCKNGVLFLDEFEKIADNQEIMSCLLHITDFTQNSSFRDNFFSELSIDLSCLWFIYSMNNVPQDEALKDRIFYIDVEGYSMKEKIHIIRDYLIPKHLKNIGKKIDDISINDETLQCFLSEFTSLQEKGIRNIERHVKELLHKIYFLAEHQDQIPCSFLLAKDSFPIRFPFFVTIEIIRTLLTKPKSTPFSNMFL